jgi:hypothetical protein
MTNLLSYADRIANGENTIERAILGTSLRLHQATRTIDALKENVKIVPAITQDDTTGTTMTFGSQIDLTLDSSISIAKEFDLLLSATNYANTAPLLPIDSVAPLTDLIESLPQEPSEVDSLEKYILWLGLVLANSIYPQNKYFSLSYPEDQNPYKIRLTFTLPLDYRKHLAGANYLEAAVKIVDYHITEIGQLPGSIWSIPPSTQFWGDPIADVAALKALTGVTLGTTRWLTEKGAHYTLIDSLPIGSTADDDLFVAPTTPVATEVWKKGGTGQGGGSSLTAGQIRDALEGLADTNRLDASAIQNLPTNSGTPGKNPEFQASLTHIQYRLVGDSTWIDLIPLSDIVGPPGEGDPGKSVELQKTSTYLQWRLVGDSTWIDLIPLADLKGDPGSPGVAGSVSSASSLILTQIATPSDPGTGKTALYSKEDGEIYIFPSGGVEKAIGTGGVSPVGREVLTANRIYYVRTDGSDSNNGLTDNSGNAFLTPQKGFDTINNLDKNGFNCKVKLADGTYLSSSPILIKTGIGDGLVTLEGNTSTPANVVIRGDNNTSTIKVQNLSGVIFDSFTIDGITSIASARSLIDASNSQFHIKNLRFGTLVSSVFTSQINTVKSLITAESYTITGGSHAHLFLIGSSVLNLWETALTITLVGTPTFFYFTIVDDALARINKDYVTFSGEGSGTRYLVRSNGAINTNGGGRTYLPGTIDGITVTNNEYS